MKKVFLCFLFAINFLLLQAQDGKIITNFPHAIEDSDKVYFQKRFKIRILY